MRPHIEPKQDMIGDSNYSVYPDSPQATLGALVCFPNPYGDKQHQFVEPPGVIFVQDSQELGFYYAPAPVEWQQQRTPVAGYAITPEPAWHSLNSRSASLQYSDSLPTVASDKLESAPVPQRRRAAAKASARTKDATPGRARSSSSANHLDTEGNKLCRRCNQEKPLNCFYRSKANPDGLDGRCKTCDAAICKERRRKKRRVEVPTVDTKKCRSCGLQKPAQSFYRNATNHDGLYNMCKACFAEKNRGRGGTREDTQPVAQGPAMQAEGPYLYEESLSSFPGVAK